MGVKVLTWGRHRFETAAAASARWCRLCPVGSANSAEAHALEYGEVIAFVLHLNESVLHSDAVLRKASARKDESGVH